METYNCLNRFNVNKKEIVVKRCFLCYILKACGFSEKVNIESKEFTVGRRRIEGNGNRFKCGKSFPKKRYSAEVFGYSRDEHK